MAIIVKYFFSFCLLMSKNNVWLQHYRTSDRVLIKVINARLISNFSISNHIFTNKAFLLLNKL